MTLPQFVFYLGKKTMSSIVTNTEKLLLNHRNTDFVFVSPPITPGHNQLKNQELSLAHKSLSLDTRVFSEAFPFQAIMNFQMLEERVQARAIGGAALAVWKLGGWRRLIWRRRLSNPQSASSTESCFCI